VAGNPEMTGARFVLSVGRESPVAGLGEIEEPASPGVV
jgi:hypothetical protein